MHILVQGSFDFGVSNINPTMTLPYGVSPAAVTPPIIRNYTNMLFQVQQNSSALPRSAQLHFDGTGGPGNTMDHN
jgi:hypothetical protein